MLSLPLPLPEPLRSQMLEGDFMAADINAQLPLVQDPEQITPPFDPHDEAPSAQAPATTRTPLFTDRTDAGRRLAPAERHAHRRPDGRHDEDGDGCRDHALAGFVSPTLTP